MKRRFFMCSVFAFFLLMLLFPGPVFRGASDGLLLWFQIVLPTLLPFLIISNLLVGTHAIDWIGRVVGPILCPILGVSKSGSYAVLAGFLCGYPMGSKITADLMASGRIAAAEGRYLLSFCNNTSPMFILSFVVLQSLKAPELTIPSLVILMLSPFLCSFLFRRIYIHLSHRETTSARLPASAPSMPASSARHREKPELGSLMDSCIMNGFEGITKVGGYIMLFSIGIELLMLLPFQDSSVFLVLLSSLEVTSGITLLCGSALSAPALFVLCLALTSFGGWCSVAQTRCMLQGSGLPILPYIAEKLVTAFVTSLLAMLYLLFFPLGG